MRVCRAPLAGVAAGLVLAAACATSLHAAQPVAGTWTLSGNLSMGRALHTATLLDGPRCHAGIPPPGHCGKVLIAGGSDANSVPLASAELFDPLTATSRPTAQPMTSARAAHTATLLADGRVLVVGGGAAEGGYANLISMAEIYDPGSDSWTQAGHLAVARAAHTATRLPDGRVLIAGGYRQDSVRDGLGNFAVDDGDSLASSEVYDPAHGARGTWATTGDLTYGRAFFSATPVRDQVLAVGGYRGVNHDDDPQGPDAVPEMFVPSASQGRGAWLPTTDGILHRVFHTATPLGSGDVLVVGGTAHEAPLGVTNTAELFHPQPTSSPGAAISGSWAPVAPMTVPRENHTATILPGGGVLVVGGQTVSSLPAGPQAEVYDPRVGAWSPAGALNYPRVQHTATALGNRPCDVNDGEVLVAGGQEFGVTSSPGGTSTEVYPRPLSPCPPAVTSIAPATLVQGATAAVTIQGAWFAAGATVDLGSGVSVAATGPANQSAITVTASVDGAAALGPRDVAVTNPDGLAGRCAGCLSITRPGSPPGAPGLSSLAPASGPTGGGLAVTLKGVNLAGVGKVIFGTLPPVLRCAYGRGPAPCFTADPGGGAISVITPAAPSAGAVPVVVVAPALPPSNALRFTYSDDGTAPTDPDQLTGELTRAPGGSSGSHHTQGGTGGHRQPGLAAPPGGGGGTGPAAAPAPPPGSQAGLLPGGGVIPAPLPGTAAADAGVVGLPGRPLERVAPERGHPMSRVVPPELGYGLGAACLAGWLVLAARPGRQGRPRPAPRRA